MKLLSIIAAVLISISAYSQDYVEYKEGTFSRNGEELTMEQVLQLSRQYKVPFYQNRWMAINQQIRICESKFRRIATSSLYIIGTPIMALGTPLMGLITQYIAADGKPFAAVMFGACTGFTAFLTVYFPYTAFEHSTKDRCQNKVDKLCEKLVEKLNKKIEVKYRLLGY